MTPSPECEERALHTGPELSAGNQSPCEDCGPGNKPQTAEELLPLVYGELRRLAAARMANEWETSTLQPTALVHEAWLRLTGTDPSVWNDRAHFFGAAAEAMRRILIDRARRKHTLKRGSHPQRLKLDSIEVPVQPEEESLLALNDALEKLAAADAECAELVKLRFFGGLNYPEAAQVLGISERSAKRCWAFARAWLHRELSKTASE